MAASLIKEAKQTTCLRFNIERDLDLKLLLFNSGYYDALLLKPAPWKLAPWLRYYLSTIQIQFFFKPRLYLDPSAL